MLTEILPSFPTITTKRLTLRAPKDTDAQQIFFLRSDANVNTYLDRQPAASIEDAAAFIKKVNGFFTNNQGLYWAITQTGNDELAGTICLYDFSFDEKKCEIGYELLPAYQGSGIMKEAASSVVAFAFQTMAFKTINAFTHKHNQSSIKLLQKLNFREMGAAEEAGPHMVLYNLENEG